MRTVEVLSIQRISPADRARIEGVDPAVHLVDAGGWFDGEIRETWPPFAAARYLVPGSQGVGSRAERDSLLARAEVILGGWPFPLDLRARAPRLRWFHQRPAGASNLRMGDLWGSDVTVTTSRGLANARLIAEYAIATIMHFAKGLPQAEIDRTVGTFNARAYRPLSLEGKTTCIVGTGGIGCEVGRLAAALGMRVIGTRRSPDPSQPLPEGFSRIGGSDDLTHFLRESDFVVICCHWTPETTGLIDRPRLAVMKPGSVLVNVARGEIIDEVALTAALAADHLRGVALDVYDGEFERPPLPALWQHSRVMITPHISGNGDADQHGAIDLFCENLRAWLDGAPLRNVVDWERGY